MEFNLKMLRENAIPDCKICKGLGYRLIDKNKREFGKCTVGIGEHSFQANDLIICDKIKVLCPRCFDPNGKPRDGQRVKK